MDARSLVLWIGDHHGSILDEPGTDVVGSVAMRLANAPRNTAALRRARRTLGLGVSLDTECWRNQCRPDHRLRRAPFRTLGYDVRDLFDRDRVDIDKRLTEAQITEYATAILDGQVRADPTIFQCGGHVTSTKQGTENEIRLAEATLDLVDARALREPADGDKHKLRRALFATICVHPRDLTPTHIKAIVERYVRLPVDGYWIWAIGFEPSGVQAEAMLRLTLALQENSGRPACPGGLRHLWQAALARGAAAAIAGPDRGAVPFEPEEPPPPPRDPEDEDEGKRRMHTYHGAVLGCFGFDEDGDEACLNTFRRNPCGCGRHDRALPPKGRKETTAHNQAWRLDEARGACVGSAAQASGRLGLRLPLAASERSVVGVKGRLPVGWHRAAQGSAEAPVGWGAADGRVAA